MKTLILFNLLLFTSFVMHSQNPIGAWEATHVTDQGKKLKTVVIFSDGYQVMTQHDADTGAFIMTNGGLWKLDGNTMIETIEFDTNNPDRVGTQVSFKVTIEDAIMGVEGSDLKLHRIDDGNLGKLGGAWLMSGRIRDGKTQQRDTNRPRKTMKLLSGTRFQWIAYNTETKQFMGTGGGTYTTINGVYTEQIEFFSRDNAKVGLKLNFDYKLVDTNWHHSGFSSKGDPIYEIWSQRSNPSRN